MKDIIHKNVDGLRDHLFNTLEKLSDHKIRIDEVETIGKIAKQINNTYNLEFKHKQLDHKIKMDLQNADK